MKLDTYTPPILLAFTFFLLYYFLMIDANVVDHDPRGHEGVSDYEADLFTDGAFVTDFYAEVAKSDDRLRSTLEWIQRNPRLNDVTRELHTRRAQDRDRHGIEWRTAYSGQIPKHWIDKKRICTDIEQADKRGVQLSEPLINAAISHMDHTTALEAAMRQDLDVDQLTIVLSRPDISEGRRADIIMEQHDRGMADEAIDEAATRAEEIRARTREEASDGQSHTPLMFTDRATRILEARMIRKGSVISNV